ncbi:cell division protein FtsQ/DivIB [Salipaludibacillus daqingensis]|uniref:cell division protein FtsQ/DivIB n=1 Tax=Salipaludibacillus daqingensis TaxID=3041001 RepID=UPI002475773D|nr:FtsQ-type POTRA domain-containing protein [Salipaludibacillus daqingensis]
MKEKKVVEIEERIPKLKERRKQRTNRRLIFYVSIFFFLMLMIVYFQSSFSQIQHLKIEGNVFASDEWIETQSQLLEEVSMWNINESDISKRISEHDAINEVSISREWLNTVVLRVNEFESIAYIRDDQSYLPVLESGEIFDSNQESKVTPHDAPILHDFENEEARKTMVSQLTETSTGMRNRISDIFLAPVENDPYRLTIFMNDGFVVSSTANNFAERIVSYPSVVEQLDPDVAGIVHMRINPYFERFETEEEEEEEEEGFESEG